MSMTQPDPGGNSDSPQDIIIEGQKGMFRLAMPVLEASEDVIAEILSEETGECPVLWTNALTGARELHLYLDGDETPNMEEWTQLWNDIVSRVAEAGLETIALPAEVRLEAIKREDWANSWKEHFHPIEIDDSLLIKPTWITTDPKPGQAVVLLDPGLSFGTGNHPTTYYCLSQVATFRLKAPLGIKSMLDVGCGTGILGIAAAKLGYSPVHGFDYDPEAVRVAQENSELNEVEEQITWSVEDLKNADSLSDKRYDLVCANVIYDVLLDEAASVVRWLKSTSRLVLSGILDEQFERVSGRFNKLGWKCVESCLVDEWRSGSFEFKGADE